MFDKLKSIFGSGAPEPAQSRDEPPRILGLQLGGSFTIDPMLLKTMEPELTIEGASSTQIIQAVGVVRIDEQHRLVRYYTDDEGFIQILQYGEDESGIQEIGLWYFFDSKAVAESNWKALLDSGVVSSEYQLDGQTFEKFWQDSAPVPMVEKTYHKDGKISETTQFAMAYTRALSNDEIEMLLVSAEERVNKIHNTVERELIRSTGFNLQGIDITSN